MAAGAGAGPARAAFVPRAASSTGWAGGTRCSSSTTASTCSSRRATWSVTMAETGPELTVLVHEPAAARVPGRGGLPGRAAGPAVIRRSRRRSTALPAVRLFVDRPAAARLGQELDAEQLERGRADLPTTRRHPAGRGAGRGTGPIHRPARSAGAPPSTSPLLAMPVPDHPRHRTLLSTIAWSYDLLPPESRALFDRLSVFSGSWTVEAARTVCADDQMQADVLGVLADLVDRSMIVAELRRPDALPHAVDAARFRGRPAGRAEQTAERRARHARFYADLAEAAEPGLRTAEEATWVTRLERRLRQPAAAHLWAIENADVDLDARLLVASVELRAAAAVGRVLPLGRGGVREPGVRRPSPRRRPPRHRRARRMAAGRPAPVHALVPGRLRRGARLGSGISLPARMAIVVATALRRLVRRPARDRSSPKRPPASSRSSSGAGRWAIRTGSSTAWSTARSAWYGGRHERARRSPAERSTGAHGSGCPTSLAHGRCSRWRPRSSGRIRRCRNTARRRRSRRPGRRQPAGARSVDVAAGDASAPARPSARGRPAPAGAARPLGPVGVTFRSCGTRSVSRRCVSGFSARPDRRSPARHGGAGRTRHAAASDRSCLRDRVRESAPRARLGGATVRGGKRHRRGAHPETRPRCSPLRALETCIRGHRPPRP